MVMRPRLAWWLLVGALGLSCAGTTEDDLASERDPDGGSGASSGTTSGDGGPWPDGPPSGGSSSGGTGGIGASGGAGGSGGSGGTGGSSGVGGGAGGSSGVGGSGGGTGGSSGNGGGGSGGCSPISCKNYVTCQDEPMCSCPPVPAETCNTADDNCNGGCDEGAGCRVGVHRSYHAGSGEHFYTTSASEAVCCGFTLEFSDFFFLYANATASLVPFYRCYLNLGKHFYTTSSSCEGAPGVNEGVLGYIATSAACGAVPLHRLVHVSNGDHFFTTSAAEKDSAVASGAYLYESIAGYVWTSGG